MLVHDQSHFYSADLYKIANHTAEVATNNNNNSNNINNNNIRSLPAVPTAQSTAPTANFDQLADENLDSPRRCPSSLSPGPGPSCRIRPLPAGHRSIPKTRAWPGRRSRRLVSRPRWTEPPPGANRSTPTSRHNPRHAIVIAVTVLTILWN